MSQCLQFLDAEIKQLTAHIEITKEDLKRSTEGLDLLKRTRAYLASQEQRDQHPLFPSEDAALMEDTQAVTGLKTGPALLRLIARRGQLETGYARVVLVEAGIIPNTDLGYRRIWNNLSRFKADGRVRHIAEGVYGLPDESDQDDH